MYKMLEPELGKPIYCAENTKDLFEYMALCKRLNKDILFVDFVSNTVKIHEGYFKNQLED